MPLIGNKNNVIDIEKIQSYIKMHHIPENLCIYAGGVYNHNEFLEIVTPYFSKIKPISNTP